MVKYQDRYWIETNAEWTTVQQPDITQKIKLNKTDTIATRFEVFPLVERECGSLQPLHKTEYDDIYEYHLRIRIRYAYRTKSNEKER